MMLHYAMKFLFWSHIDLKLVVEKGAIAGIQLQKLSSLSYPKISVDQRAVRDRFSKLERYFRKSMTSKERASGISLEA